MRRILLVSAIMLAAGCQASAPPTVKIETDEQKTLYSLGYLVAGNVKSFELTDDEIAIVKMGFADGAQQKQGVVDDPQAFVPKLQELQGALARPVANGDMKGAGRRRTVAPPTRSGPEGSSRNGLRTGRRSVCTFSL